MLEVFRVCGGDGGGGDVGNGSGDCGDGGGGGGDDGGNGSGDCGDGGGGDGDDGDGINVGLVLHSFGFDFRSFGLHLGSILVPFWVHFGSIWFPWGGPGAGARIVLLIPRFWGPFGLPLGSNFHKKSVFF